MVHRIVPILLFIGIAAAGAAPADPDGRQSPPDYRPVTSDLMTAFIQPRHIKLFLAGTAGNWTYAEYERHNIGGALDRIATSVPSYKGQGMAGLIAAFATPQLAALQAAIKLRDRAAFNAAYDGLTAGCNQCHVASGHAIVVIRRPDGTNPSVDQDFSAPG